MVSEGDPTKDLRSTQCSSQYEEKAELRGGSASKSCSGFFEIGIGEGSLKNNH